MGDSLVPNGLSMRVFCLSLLA